LRLNLFDHLRRPRKRLLPCVDRFGADAQPLGHLAHPVASILNLSDRIALELRTSRPTCFQNYQARRLQIYRLFTRTFCVLRVSSRNMSDLLSSRHKMSTEPEITCRCADGPAVSTLAGSPGRHIELPFPDVSLCSLCAAWPRCSTVRSRIGRSFCQLCDADTMALRMAKQNASNSLRSVANLRRSDLGSSSCTPLPERVRLQMLDS